MLVFKVVVLKSRHNLPLGLRVTVKFAFDQPTRSIGN